MAVKFDRKFTIKTSCCSAAKNWALLFQNAGLTKNGHYTFGVNVYWKLQNAPTEFPLRIWLGPSENFALLFLRLKIYSYTGEFQNRWMKFYLQWAKSKPWISGRIFSFFNLTRWFSTNWYTLVPDDAFWPLRRDRERLRPHRMSWIG